MEQLFSQYGRIITSRILVDQVTGIVLFHLSYGHSVYVGGLYFPLVRSIKCTSSSSCWFQGNNIGLFSYSEQEYHEEWASSGLTSEMKQRRLLKVWTDRSPWVPLSPSLSSSPTTPARRQAKPYWLSCTRLLPVATRAPCTTRLSVSGTEALPPSHYLWVYH